MEQFVRDARIPMIYEGANGIQALDLVARKLPKDGGRALKSFLGEIAGFVEEHGDEAMKPFIAPLAAALGQLRQATSWLAQNATENPDRAGAAASDFMHLMGLVALAYMWGRMAATVLTRVAADRAEAERLGAKLVVGQFFMERILPETAVHLARIRAGAGSTMELPADAF